MKAEFTVVATAVTAATLNRALDMMAKLYTEAGSAHHREQARRATEELMANPERGGVWLIEAQGETAGYICITICFSLEFGGAFALLDELYLDAAWRGRGLGTQAIAFACAWSRARGLAAIRLEAAHTNARAIELYQREGFQPHARHLMTKWL